MRITRADGLLTVAQVAELCGVGEAAVRMSFSRGYLLRDGSARIVLPVARKEGRLNLVDPVEAAKYEYHTRVRARRAAA